MMSRNELHITALDERHFADLTAEYVTPTDAKYVESKNNEGEARPEPAIQPPQAPRQPMRRRRPPTPPPGACAGRSGSLVPDSSFN